MRTPPEITVLISDTAGVNGVEEVTHEGVHVREMILRLSWCGLVGVGVRDGLVSVNFTVTWLQ